MFKYVTAKLQGVVRSAIWSPFSDETMQDVTLDDMGRVVTWPYQVRDLITTAQASLTTGTVTTLLAGATSTFHDLLYIKFSNNSAATTVDLIDDGTVVMNDINIAASGNTEVKLPIPLPQSGTGGNWQLDLPDITGTTISVDALFIKNK